MITIAELAKRTEARRRARASDPNTRTQAALTGLRRYAARFESAGDGKLAEKLRDYADTMQKHLETEAHALASIERTDHVGDAVAAAAAELRKRLPTCFPTDDDATCFARSLPHVEARARATDAANKAGAFAKRAVSARRSFAATLEIAACAATGEVYTNRAVASLTQAGM